MVKTKASKPNRKPKRVAAVGGAGRVLRETFDGLPIVDAKADMTLVVRTTDVEAAEGNAKDASNCVLAKACARQFGSSKVMFFRTCAYVEKPEPDGKRVVTRFILDEHAAAIVRAFDKGKCVKGEVSVTLKAPKQSQSLDYLVDKQRRRTIRKAMIRGTIVNKSPSAGVYRKPRLADMDVRNGTGMVHNSVIKA